MKYEEEYADKMKYQIHGFQQKKLLDSGLSNDDALLLRVLLDMYSSAKNEFIIENNDKYLWVSYTYIKRVIPIIGSKSNIMSKIKKYEELKLIERILKFERKGEKGSWAYIKPLKGLDELTEYEGKQNEDKKDDPIQNLDRGVQNLDTLIQILYKGYPELREGLSKIWIGGIQNLDTKDLSSIYTSSIDLSSIDSSSSNFSSGQSEENKKNIAASDKKIIDFFNNTCHPSFPKITGMNDERRSIIHNWYLETNSFTEIKKCFEMAQKSKFLLGKDFATFDWIINPNNRIKILEGQYLHDKTDQKSASEIRKERIFAMRREREKNAGK